MKLIIDVDNNDYELLNKTVITLNLHTIFHGKDKDKKLTFAIFDLIKALKNGIPYEEKPQGGVTMDNDLISRAALQEEHSKECIHNCYYCQHFKWSKKKACSYCDVIDNAPTAQYIIKVNTAVEAQTIADELKRQEAVGVIIPNEFEIERLDRPHGEWLRTTHDIKGEHPQTACWYKCSVCNKDNPVNIMFEHCPNCGADMRGGEDNR